MLNALNYKADLKSVFSLKIVREEKETHLISVIFYKLMQKEGFKKKSAKSQEELCPTQMRYRISTILILKCTVQVYKCTDFNNFPHIHIYRHAIHNIFEFCFYHFTVFHFFDILSHFDSASFVGKSENV